MKELNVMQMEQINGGTEIPQWLTCGAAVAGTFLFFGSILAGNVAAAILGPTALGVDIAACIGG